MFSRRQLTTLWKFTIKKSSSEKSFPAQNTTFTIDSTLDLKNTFQPMKSLRKELEKYIDPSRFHVGRSNKKMALPPTD